MRFLRFAWPILFCLHVFVSIALPSQAQADQWLFESRAPDYTGARAIGLGNAYAAVAEGAVAGIWNPAGMIQSEGVAVMGQMKANHRQEWAFDPKAIRFAYHPWAFSWGNKIAVRLPGRTPDYTYYVLAYQVASNVSVGTSVSFERRHPWDTYQWFGIYPKLHLATLIHLGNAIRLGVTTQGTEALELGLSHANPSQLIAARLRLDFSGKADANLFFGIERHLWKGWQARLGLSSGSPTMGLGWRWRTLRLDCAWIRENAESSHFVSLELSR